MDDFIWCWTGCILPKGPVKLPLIEQTLREMFDILLYSVSKLTNVEGGNDDFSRPVDPRVELLVVIEFDFLLLGSRRDI